jgi:hypothetical protein
MFKFASNKISVPQIWMNSFALYKQTLKSIWYLVVAMQLVPVIFAFGARLVGVGIIHEYIYFAMIVSSLINLYIVSTALHRMHSLVDDKNYRLCASCKFVWSKFLKIAAIMIAAFVLIAALTHLANYLESVFTLASTIWKIPTGIAFVTTLLTLMFLSIVVIFTFPFILFKEATIINVCKKSVELIWGNWLRTFLVFFVPSIILMLIRKEIMVFGFRFVAFSLPLLLTYTLLILIITALLLPYLKALLLVQFNDLLYRKKT